MSNQTYGDRVKDAVQKRREYLWKKWCVYCWALFGILTLVRVFTGLLEVAEVRSRTSNLNTAITIALSAAFLTTLGAAVCRTVHRESKTIPYVPPVAEQIAALPAEAILVRGSDQPAAVPDELLRAAQAGAETEAGELLRAGEQAQPGKE